jgi:hypothetical protein
MGGLRWALIPLAVALVVDVALVARYETSAGATVSRAIVRGAALGSCDTSTVVRTDAGNTPQDSLIVADTWTAGKNVLQTAANPAFGPGGQLVPQSQQTIEEGLDIQHQTATPIPAALLRGGQPPLVENYLAQIHRGATWLSGPCLAFANPMRSHLGAVGSLKTASGDFRVYRGELTASGTGALFQRSEVYLGVSAQGRVGFELLLQLPAPNANPAVVFVAEVMRYNAPLLSGLAKHGVAQREAFYANDYRDVMRTVREAQLVGPPVKGVGPVGLLAAAPAPSASSVAPGPVRAP